MLAILEKDFAFLLMIVVAPFAVVGYLLGWCCGTVVYCYKGGWSRSIEGVMQAEKDAKTAQAIDAVLRTVQGRSPSQNLQ